MKRGVSILGVICLFFIAGCSSDIESEQVDDILKQTRADLVECENVLDNIKSGKNICVVDTESLIFCNDFMVTDKEIILVLENVGDEEVSATVKVDECGVTDTNKLGVDESKLFTIKCFTDKPVIYKDFTIDYVRRGIDYTSTGRIYSIIGD